MWPRLAVLVLGLAPACAGGTSDPTDAAGPDAAPRPDAPPQAVVLTQVSDSATITPGTSIGCVNQTTFVARENSWYRAFTLTEHGISGGFAVSEVTFAIEQAHAAAGGSQPAYVRLYRYTGFVGGTLDPAAMALLADEPITVADSPSPELLSVPIAGAVAAGEDLVVEIYVADSDPENDGTGNVFFVGANSAGQTKPPYLRAPIGGCDLIDPTQLTLVGPGFPGVHMSLTVTGTPQ